MPREACAFRRHLEYSQSHTRPTGHQYGRDPITLKPIKREANRD